MSNHDGSSDDETRAVPRRRPSTEPAPTQRLDATPRTHRLQQTPPPRPQSYPYPPSGHPGGYQAPHQQYGPPPPQYPMQPYAPRPVAPPPVYNSVVTTGRPPASGALVVIAWILALLTLGYLIPWAIAATRNKSNQGGIFVLNFFLGWSLIGWVVSLVMACGNDSQTNVVVVNHPPQQYYR